MPASRTLASIETYEVNDFKIARPGYGFNKGDVFKPVGLVTDRNLSTPQAEFSLTVIDTFSDSFSAWQFGELDYIDSIAEYQNGSRVRFPLRYNGDLLLSAVTLSPTKTVCSVIVEPSESVVCFLIKISSSCTFSPSAKDFVDPSPINVSVVTLLLETLYLSTLNSIFLNSNPLSLILFLSSAENPGWQYQIGIAFT